MNNSYYRDFRDWRGAAFYEGCNAYDGLDNLAAYNAYERDRCYNPCNRDDDYIILTHVHEIVGEVRFAERGRDVHNHHFSGVTDEVICVPGGHIHVLHTKTDFFENHFHRIDVRTGLPVYVGSGHNRRHVHYIDDDTSYVDGHLHKFIDATLIENPLGR